MTSIDELINKITSSNASEVVEDNEIWRAIEDYEDLYWVSSTGRVLSLNGKRLLRHTHASEGYPAVNIRKGGKSKPVYIHRLVAQAFIPNPHVLPEVYHINHNITDTRVENLRWANRGERSRNRVVKGSITLAKRGGHHCFRVQYSPNRDGKKKDRCFRIKDINNEESVNEAKALASAFRDKVVAEINAQLSSTN